MNEKKKPRFGAFTIGPISNILLYPNGSAMVGRISPSGVAGSLGTVRGEISRITSTSRNRLAFFAAETTIELKSMITLTYGINWPRDGKVVKKHLNAFMVWARRNNVIQDYIWFLEFQKRGAPHVHILSSKRAGSAHLRSELAMHWAIIATDRLYVKYSDIVSRETFTTRHRMYEFHCRKKVWENEKKPRGMSRYAIKYATKTYQKSVPKRYSNVGRFWGMSRSVRNSVPIPESVDITEGDLRKYLEGVGHVAADWEVMPKYLFGAVPNPKD